MKTIQYYWRLVRLILRAQRVWGVGRQESFAAWEAAVRTTPLRYEVDALQRDRQRLFGADW